MAIRFHVTAVNLLLASATSAVVAAVLAATTPATAADLTSAEITKLLTGNTLYFEFPTTNTVAGGGQGIFVYTADGKVTTKMPNGQAWKGTWTVKDDNTVCLTWEVGPVPGCTRYDKTGDTTTSINAADGKPRGKLVKTAPGNPEKL
jgi:hypothetical protein